MSEGRELLGDERDRRILAAVKRLCPDGIVFQVITFTPEQNEDVVRVLVDDQAVAGFELARDDATAAPQDVVLYSVAEYQRHLNGRTAKDFRVALEFAQEKIRTRP